ncbi:MAG: hypothetical protein ABI986_00520 [Chloroflexota bacterium]
MNTTYIVIAVVLALVVIAGAILIPTLSQRNRSTRLRDQFGAEYDRTVETLGDEKKAQTQLEDRQKHVKALDIKPLSASEAERYVAEWSEVQSKFVDEPGQAIVDADRLIMEVMSLRSYPVSDFEQRAADISVTHPNFVSNYRAAREIAVKNETFESNTEELRQALIHYRSLFEELLEIEPVAV